MTKSVPEINFEQRSTYQHCTAEELYRWHSRPGALRRLLPPWEKTTVVQQNKDISPGAEVSLKMHLGPIPFCFNAQHTENIDGKMFRDIQKKGPFTSWSHAHYFSQVGENGVLLDKIGFRLPLQRFLPESATNLITRKLQRVFAYRTNQLADDLKLHKQNSLKPLRILISGASGVLGQDLLPLLTTGGHEVWTLVRRPANPELQEIFWDPDAGILNPDDIPDVDGVIHLAGEYIGLNRWSEKSKRRVIESRFKGTSLLATTLAKLPKPPEVFLSASAVGFYGDCKRRIVDESEPAGTDFISEVCTTWEEATKPAQKANIRTVQMRLGVGLTPKGGALHRILSTSPCGFHKHFGTGDQYISWISNDDMISAMLHCLATPSLSGPVNIAAPAPITNRELMKVLGEIVGRPQLFAVPAWSLRLLYGQMASEILLSGCRVSVDKLTASGFQFRHLDVTSALRHMLGKYD